MTVYTEINAVIIHCIKEKDVRKWKEELLDQRRRMMEEKLLHAEFKREVQLQAIVKKAQEEEAKVIGALITELVFRSISAFLIIT